MSFQPVIKSNASQKDIKLSIETHQSGATSAAILYLFEKRKTLNENFNLW